MFNFIRKHLSQVCYGCGSSTMTTSGLCQYCWQNLPWQATNLCRLCHLRPISTYCFICGDCQQQDLPHRRMQTACVYTGLIKKMIGALKFGETLAYRQTLAELLLATLDQNDLPDAILPVPLHWRRLRQRGFNQAIEIAKPIARQLKLPLLRTNIKRITDTAPQTQTHSLRARQGNIQHAFAPKQPISYRHVALLDDVITTGATVHAVANCLQRMGVESIQIWGVARTPNC